MPGETGQIDVVFSPKKSQAGSSQVKSVSITANTDPTNTILTIKAYVNPVDEIIQKEPEVENTSLKDSLDFDIGYLLQDDIDASVEGDLELESLYSDFGSFEEALIYLGIDDKVDGVIKADTITVLNFESYVLREYDFEENATFSTYISYFPNLKKLILPNEFVSIKELLLSNPELEYIKATGKYTCIESLDITHLKKLKFLSIGNGCLDSLDISQNTELTTLYCYGINLTLLDISNNPKLQTLYCDRNQLKVLDISNNPNLSKLMCFNTDGCVRIEAAKDESYQGWQGCIESPQDGVI